MKTIRIRAGLYKNEKQLYEDICIYTELPKGWVKLSNTIFNKKRFVWIHENKSIFTKEGRKKGLLILN